MNRENDVERYIPMDERIRYERRKVVRRKAEKAGSFRLPLSRPHDLTFSRLFDLPNYRKMKRTLLLSHFRLCAIESRSSEVKVSLLHRGHSIEYILYIYYAGDSGDGFRGDNFPIFLPQGESHLYSRIGDYPGGTRLFRGIFTESENE